MTTLVLGVDGGNSKTDVLLADLNGNRLASARGGVSSPHQIGLAAAIDVIDGLITEAFATAGLERRRPIAHAALCVAGIDLPDEDEAFLAAARAAGWAADVATYNDTHALLHAGTRRGWGVAMVAGAGTNCLGIAPDGRTATFPSLGYYTGDMGGGLDIGRLALHHASRAHDGRGPASVLTERVPAFFGMATPYELAIAIHRKEIAPSDLLDLTPLVFAAAAEGDAVAGVIVAQQATEIVANVRAVIVRLGLEGTDVPVVLGGGMLAAANPLLIEPIEHGVLAVAPRAEIIVCAARPVLGAMAIALAAAGASEGARQRLFED